ncbi:MAG: hypothetical protein ABI977_15980 [Acidobacteriota bacterium]
MNCKDIQTAIDSATRRSPINPSASTHIASCSDCRRHADQSSALLALLGAQPRVEVPADFAFRLRASIARAESEPKSPFAFLENLFGQSFSIRQTAAALAVMAAATTFYFTGSNQPATNSGAIANVEKSAQQETQRVVIPVEEKNSRLIASTSNPVLKAASSPRVNSAKVAPATFTRETHIAAANKENMDRIYVRGQVMEIPTRTFIGAEGSVAKAKPAVYTAGL